MTNVRFEYKEESCSALFQQVRIVNYLNTTGGILTCIINKILTSTVMTPELASDINVFISEHGSMYTPFSGEHSLIANIYEEYIKRCEQDSDEFPTDLFLDGLKAKYYIAKEIVDAHQLYQQQRKEMLAKITPTKVTAMIKRISPAGIERIVKFLDPESTMDINELFNRAYEHAEVMLEYMANEKVGETSFIAEESDFIYVHSV